MTERQVPGAIDDAEFPSNLAQGSVPVDALRLHASLEPLPVMEQEALAEPHSAFQGNGFQGRFGVLVGVVVEMPAALCAPGENAVVRATLIALIKRSRRNMVPRNVRMPELIQQLPREGCRAYEDDILLALPGHLPGHEINPREMGIINRQAVMILDGYAQGLSLRGHPVDET